MAMALAACLMVLSAGTERLQKCAVAVGDAEFDRIDQVRLQVAVLRLSIAHCHAAGVMVGVMDILASTATMPPVTWADIAGYLLALVLVMALLAECVLWPLRNHFMFTLVGLERHPASGFPVVPADEGVRKHG